MGVDLLNTFIESIEVEDSRHKKQFIQNYIPWAWDVTERKGFSDSCKIPTVSTISALVWSNLARWPEWQERASKPF